MTTKAEPTPEAATALTVLDDAPGIREAWLMLADKVPEGNESAYADIIRTLVNADSPEQLNDPWSAEGLRDWIDRDIVVKSIKRLPSTFPAGLGFFLVCDCYDPRTDKPLVLTTGSVSTVAQLVKAHTAGWLPLRVVPRGPKHETPNGTVPLRLEVIGQVAS